jgi:hypothetical protein
VSYEPNHEGNVEPMVPGVAAAAGVLIVLAAFGFCRRHR